MRTERLGVCRTLVVLVLAVVLLAPAIGRAQAPLRIVVPNAPGGTQDLVARLIARHMYPGSGQAVIVDNRPGGESLIAMRNVMRSPPDGRTLLITSTSFVFAGLKNPSEIDLQRDFVPVIKVANGEMLVAVNAASDIKSLADLKRAAAARPQGLNCGALPGQTELACSRLGRLIGGNVATIPFHSLAPAVNALVAGHIDLVFSPRGAVQPLDGQKLRVIASAADTKPLAPYQGLPMMRDIWPGLRMITTTSIYAPPGTPPAAIASLNHEINRVIELPEVRNALVELGYSMVGGSPEVLAKGLAEEMVYYRGMLQEAVAAERGTAPR